MRGSVILPQWGAVLFPDADDAVFSRGRALAWLQDELAAWTAKGEAQREAAVVSLTHWEVDTDLAGVREAAALASLPEAERGAWGALWRAVATWTAAPK